MSFTEQQKHQLNKLYDYRDEITNALFHMERIIKEYFPEEFETAYQHWIPQITTALYEEQNKWLPRGEFTLQQTLNRLQDKGQELDNKGVSKYI